MRTAICPTQVHFRRLAGHFLSLTSGDRLLRFGSVLTDIDIVAYLEQLFVSATRMFAVVEPDQGISGVATLEFTERDATLGLSVSSWARNLGIGTLLLEQAGRVARARGPKTLFVRNLRFNTALQQLALSLGMNVVCAAGALAALPDPTAVDGHQLRERGAIVETITLADDSLRGPN